MESNKRKRANHRRGTEASETVSATRAQNEFGRLLARAAAGERVVITRHNRPAAVLIPANDYAGLDDPISEIEGGLDSDVAIRLDKLCERVGTPRRTLLNDLLRRGLEDLHRGPGPRPGYVIQPHDGGRCYLRSLDSTQDALAFGEGEGYR